MADPFPPGGLWDRAGHVFTQADQLGRAFRDEQAGQSQKGRTDPAGWDRHQPAFDALCAAVLGLRDPMQSPPDSFAPVAAELLNTARVSRRVRDAMRRPDGRADAAYLDFFADLCSVADAGRRAVRATAGAGPPDDPFAFVDAPAAGPVNGIDTTPAVAIPPARVVAAAGLRIPTALADVRPNHAGVVELPADHLAKQLQDAGHTLAAAQWAIHDAVQAGRLRPERVVVELPMPGFSHPDPRGPARVWVSGQRGTRSIPAGKSAPFDCFKVVPTDALWAWWRSADSAGPRAADTVADGAGFIPRLLAGPDDADLSPRELALLEAHLRGSVSLETILREKRATGRSQTQTDRRKLSLIRSFNRGLMRSEGPAAGRGRPDMPAGVPAADPVPPRRKRSTERGDGRAKLIAALTRHHQYAAGGCLNLEPAGNNALAREASVAKRTASAFFADKFGGHAKYKALCRDASTLVAALKLLNDEFSPHDLYGRRPAGEDGREAS